MADKVPTSSLRDETKVMLPVLHICPAFEALLLEPTLKRPEVGIGDVEPSLSEGLLNGIDESVDIVIPSRVTQLDSTPPTER